MNKLLKHFGVMQDRMRAFVEPGPYIDMHGSTMHAGKTHGAAFISDMIYLMDGPEQREAQADAEFDYLAESARTVSDKFYGELVDFGDFASDLKEFIRVTKNLDRYKKLLFYGEDKTKGRFGDLKLYDGETRGDKLVSNIVQLVVQLDDEDGPWIGDKDAEQLIHAVLGVATEAGELVEALYGVAVERQLPDTVNFIEESGDLKWYLAILARIFGRGWQYDERTNINKLRRRFPKRFVEDKANNRDLAAERRTLEDGDTRGQGSGINAATLRDDRQPASGDGSSATDADKPSTSAGGHSGEGSPQLGVGDSTSEA